MNADDMASGRRFLKAEWESFDGIVTDQNAGKPAPPIQKPYPDSAEIIRLPKPEKETTNGISVFDAVAERKSRRRLKPDPLTAAELGFLLWATQGIRRTRSAHTALRTVPSAGARHPFETYLYLYTGDDPAPGLYRYLPVEHALLLESRDPAVGEQITKGLFDQRFGAAAVFLWTVIPYRTEWRYAFVAPKIIALDAGHLCQNLYLACEAIDCGTCAVGAYDQRMLDQAVGVDGNDEFVIYAAPVGKR